VRVDEELIPGAKREVLGTEVITDEAMTLSNKKKERRRRRKKKKKKEEEEKKIGPIRKHKKGITTITSPPPFLH
jgi:hypothetical protein